VFYEDKKGVQNYFYIEKSESMRVIAILKILPKLKKWAPVSKIAEMIGAKLPATLWTVQKMAGALYIDLKLPDGKRKIVAKRPVLLLRKEQHNTRNNLRKQKYLRASVCVEGLL
jgi:hypothetical protein